MTTVLLGEWETLPFFSIMFVLSSHLFFFLQKSFFLRTFFLFLLLAALGIELMIVTGALPLESLSCPFLFTFCFVFKTVLSYFCLGILSWDLPASASWVAGITGVHYHILLEFLFHNRSVSHVEKSTQDHKCTAYTIFIKRAPPQKDTEDSRTPSKASQVTLYLLLPPK
jgi:hypothetical protein